MPNLDELLDWLKAEYPDAVQRGKAFEKVCKWYLETDPAWRDQFKTVWMWNDWPDRWGRDIGIDLVAETHVGNLWAIQVKCYIDTSVVPTEDIDSFLAASGRKEFAMRMLISTGRISQHGMIKLENQDKPVVCVLRPDLEKSRVNWLESDGPHGGEVVNASTPTNKPRSPSVRYAPGYWKQGGKAAQGLAALRGMSPDVQRSAKVGQQLLMGIKDFLNVPFGLMTLNLGFIIPVSVSQRLLDLLEKELTKDYELRQLQQLLRKVSNDHWGRDESTGSLQ